MSEQEVRRETSEKVEREKLDGTKDSEREADDEQTEITETPRESGHYTERH